MKADYIRSAQMKGLGAGAMVVRHVLRNAINPALSMAGLQLGFMFASVVVVEQIFNWPGIGNYLAASIPVDDFPAIAGGSPYCWEPCTSSPTPPSTSCKPWQIPPGSHCEARSASANRHHPKEIRVTSTNTRVASAAFCAATVLVAVTACGGKTSSSGGDAKPPTDGVLVLGLNGDIGQPPDPPTSTTPTTVWRSFRTCTRAW